MWKKEEDFYYFLQFLFILLGFIFGATGMFGGFQNFWIFYIAGMISLVLAKLTAIEKLLRKRRI